MSGRRRPQAIGSFETARLPRITFGAGTFSTLPAAAARHGRRVLIVAGRHAYSGSERQALLGRALAAAGLERHELIVSGEPTPEVVDAAVRAYRDRGIEVVVGLGGGSAIDTAKAVAGLLANGSPVQDHLEGVGAGRPFAGPVTPWIAVPTTAGTGSEATKNAVLSVAGVGKRSFRDDRLVASEAIVDPDLLAGCPPELIAASGMDALTQLLESYVSIRASPFTDALALSGLAAARDGLMAWHRAVRAGEPDAGEAVSGRTAMAYAALLSGITLAQAGLGAAHGLAAALGGFFTIPHGIACGATLVATVQVNVQALEARDPRGPALRRYAQLGRVLGSHAGGSDRRARELLGATLEAWSRGLDIPGLLRFGVAEADLAQLVPASRGSSMRTNPIALSDEEVAEIVRGSL
ncbi:MAG: iron-containing alcohol dehydrogenase [Candidatus Limnocylindrales bacterium]